jgi:hypothetical protein
MNRLAAWVEKIQITYLLARSDAKADADLLLSDPEAYRSMREARRFAHQLERLDRGSWFRQWREQRWLRRQIERDRRAGKIE